MTEEQWVDYYVLTKTIARLELARELLPEQDDWDGENRRRRILQEMLLWEIECAKAIEALMVTENNK